MLTGLFLLVIGACRLQDESAAGESFSYSRAMAACGPADGAAVIIDLSRTPFVSDLPPTVRVFLWRGVTTLQAREYFLGSQSSEGNVARFQNPMQAEGAVSASLRVARVRPDTTIEGLVDATFANGDRVHQQFTAAWSSRTMLCG